MSDVRQFPPVVILNSFPLFVFMRTSSVLISLQIEHFPHGSVGPTFLKGGSTSFLMTLLRTVVILWKATIVVLWKSFAVQDHSAECCGAFWSFLEAALVLDANHKQTPSYPSHDLSLSSQEFLPEIFGWFLLPLLSVSFRRTHGSWNISCICCTAPWSQMFRCISVSVNPRDFLLWLSAWH